MNHKEETKEEDTVAMGRLPKKGHCRQVSCWKRHAALGKLYQAPGGPLMGWLDEEAVKRGLDARSRAGLGVTTGT